MALTSQPVPRMPSWPLLYLAVALSSAAAFMLRLSLARILAVVADEQVAFIVMTIAMLGLVAGALSVPVILRGKGVYTRLGVISLATCGLSLWSVLTAVSSSIGLGSVPVWLVCVPCFLPFLGTGLVLAVAVNKGIDRIGSICGFALLGAAGGCIAVVSLLHAVGGPNSVLAAAVVYAAAGAIWFSMEGRRIGRILGVMVGLFFTLLVMVNAGYKLIEIRYAKGHTLNDRLYVKWNSFSRVSLVPAPAGMTGISVDAAPGKPIVTPEELRRSGPGIGALLRPGAKTLVIEPGGGLDVARALGSGSRDVTGVEVNAIIGKAVMQQRFPHLSSRLYARPEVHIFIEEGLSFLRRRNEKFGVIDINLPVLTPDALREYMEHLTRDGILVAGQGDSGPMLPAARAALEALHIADPEDHLLFAGDALVVSLRPLDLIEIARVRMRYPNTHPEWPAPFRNPAALIAAGSAVLLVFLLALLHAPHSAQIFLPYFLVIGVASIYVSYALVHVFSGFLGHPTYGLTIVLFVFLLGAGAGSYAGEKQTSGSGSVLPLLLGVVAALIAAGAFVLQPLLALCGPLPLAARLLLTTTLVAPVGFALGLPFPVGLRILAQNDQASVPAAWSLYVASGILGSVAVNWF